MFRLTTRDGVARLGRLELRHGRVDTPAFMPVGTRASVRSLNPKQLQQLGAQIILGNAYHLDLRPGSQVVAQMGGLAAFSGWHKPTLTDSGGFQVFSLKEHCKLQEEGVTFTDPHNGQRLFITPESAMQTQQRLGADIIMAFDECTSYPASYEEAQVSMNRSMRWATRCRDAHQDGKQYLFGIIQGGVYSRLREESLQQLLRIGFAGYAIGGLAVGETKTDMLSVLDVLGDAMPADAPRYLMGVGTPLDIVEGVARGIDMFDCVMPTRNARNGTLFTSNGLVKIRNARYATSETRLDQHCDCYTCNNFGLAYLHHLEKNRELLYYQLASLHNLRVYMSLMEQIRAAIGTGNFASFYRAFRESPLGRA